MAPLSDLLQLIPIRCDKAGLLIPNFFAYTTLLAKHGEMAKWQC